MELRRARRQWSRKGEYDGLIGLVVADLAGAAAGRATHLGLSDLEVDCIKADAPEIVRDDIYMLNVGRLDTVNTSYSSDFYLSFECDSECRPGGFEFMNGRAAATGKQSDAPGDKLYRIAATYNTKVDFKNYP